MSARVPALAVVTVTADRYATVRRTLRHLREQTVSDRIEILLVGPHADSFAELTAAEVAGFAGCQTLVAGPIQEVERAFALGVQAARAPVVALLENHVYPEPTWAAAILRAHEGPWVAVGSIIGNANPASATSWVEHFLTYAFDDVTAAGGEVPRVARNNTTFKRAALLEFGRQLPDALARDGGMLEELTRRGYRFYREPTARMVHLNPSRLAPMLRLRVLSARAFAATRARTGQWSPVRRLVYALASPVFPLLRLRALWPHLRRHPQRHVFVRIAPLFAIALALDALGQALGFALGAGESAVRAGLYDLDRLPHLSPADHARFAE